MFEHFKRIESNKVTKTMEAKKEFMKNIVERVIKADVLSRAMFEDYVKVMSKHEGCTEDEVRSRIEVRYNELLMELKELAKKALGINENQ